ncbi:hypothetical protein [Sulfitobacter sp. JB4-11]|uniref:hypothetical protein n=1 Tax=Sulfitobacter rhodophyticola TaxID=3238304 RepID=UPI003515BB9E
MQVLQMKPFEQVVLDQDRLGALYSELGPSGAEDVVCRAMEELAQRLARSNTLYHTSDWTGLRKNTRSLIAIAEQVGMFTLAKVACDVTICIDRQDEIALAATLSRLIRTGERSLTAVWELQDIPI